MRRVTESDPISIEELRRLVPGRFRDMIKGVVDLRRRLLVIDADMHADQEASLLADGSDQRDLWGINLYPQLEPPRLREIARVREVVVDFFDGPNQYHSTAAGLQRYFDAYALAARP